MQDGVTSCHDLSLTRVVGKSRVPLDLSSRVACGVTSCRVMLCYAWQELLCYNRGQENIFSYLLYSGSWVCFILFVMFFL